VPAYPGKTPITRATGTPWVKKEASGTQPTRGTGKTLNNTVKERGEKGDVGAPEGKKQEVGHRGHGRT